MRKLYSAITTLLFAFCFSATAQEISIEGIEAQPITSQGDLHDILYAKPASSSPSKVRQDASPNGEVVNYLDRINNMPEYFYDFINQFVEAGRTVLEGGSSWLSDPTLGTLGSSSYYYPVNVITGEVPFTFPAGGSVDVVKQAAADTFNEIYYAEFDVLKSFLPYAFLSLNLDHPEFFWIGNTFHYGAGGSYGISYYPSQGKGTLSYTITLYFTLLANGFDLRTGGVGTYNFCDLTNLANGVQTFVANKETILSKCQEGSRYDKLSAAHDWLTLHNCYNSFYPRYSQAQIGDTPWSAYSGMEGNNGQQAPVCEGYSRAFKVLCDEMGIPCILMAGNARSGSSEGGHMWNYVQMENGKWYAIDVTWDDPTVNGIRNVVSGFESHDWFLVGSTTVIDGLPFIESHPEQWEKSYSNDGSYSWELLPGPILAPLAWTPEEEISGDVNNDNTIDISDAVSVLNAMAGEDVSGNADVNGDGNVDIADFVAVLNIMAGN